MSRCAQRIRLIPSPPEPPLPAPAAVPSTTATGSRAVRFVGADRGALSVELSDAERGILLRALFELWITQSAFDDDPDRTLIPIVATIPRERIEALVRKLGGDPTLRCSVRTCSRYGRSI